MQKSEEKIKLIVANQEKKQLKKRIKELIISRDSWKEKSMHNKARADKLENDLKKVKDKLNAIISQ